MENHYPEILRRYLGEERRGDSDIYDLTSKEAADICGRCQSTSEAAKRPEPLGREERGAFGEKIKPHFLNKYKDRYIGKGAEQTVYLAENGYSVLKVNQGRFHSNWLEYFNRLLFHRYLFPTTAYKTVGFTESDGKFAVITQQPFEILSHGAPREIVEAFLESQRFQRFKNDDYYNREISVRLEDLHDENVFLDEFGNVLFIDPVIYFETLDMKLGGQYIFHFPFNG